MSKFNWDHNWPKMQVSGHRGARFIVPENTMTAFKYAIDLGVDSIETDIRFTKDKQLVIMHDETVDRTTDGHGYVREMTLEEFKKLNAARGYEDFAPEAPPTFEEFLQLCSQQENLFLNFELNVEALDSGFRAQLDAYTSEVLSRSRRLLPEDYAKRRLPARLFDAACWLLSPYI